MKRLASCVAMIAMTACSTANTHAVAQRSATFRCTAVPWLEQGKPLVHASINGRQLTFLVDTGAEYDGWIKPEIARELGLPVVGTVPSEEEGDPTGGLPFFGVKSVRLGSIDFNERKFAEMPQIGPKPQPFDGVIGNGLFSEMQAAFDYQRGILQVTDLNLEKGDMMPFDKYGIPIVKLMIGGRQVEVNLDTGNVANKLFVTEDDAKALKFAGEPIKKGRAMTVSGTFETMEAALVDTVNYGTTVLPITTVRWPGAYDMGQIGSQGLAGQTVRIDWRNRRVSISPETTAPTCP